MSFQVRAARPDDIPEIARWTAEIFEGGDYVPERMPDWLVNPDSFVAVCVDGDDRPIGICHTTLLSPTEAWLEGARVHPGHRRSGVGSALNRAGTSWARERGARVARLATEITNTTSQAQVETLGYRRTASWAAARLETGPVELDDDRRLRLANTADVDPAWMSWALGDLAGAGRELISHGWRWRTARYDDLLNAARDFQFFQCPSGWIVAEQPDSGWLRVGWLTTTPEDAPSLIDAIIGLGFNRQVGTVRVFVPWVPWIVETLTRAGGAPKEAWVYSLAL